MAGTELDYQGAHVRLLDDKLSLTDMWKAAGSPSGRAPSDWLSLTQAIDFIGYMTETAGKSGNKPLTFTRTGRGGGTWAHWQIGLAYAKYLSPAFHAWCNSIVRAHMEGQVHDNFQHQVIERLDRIEYRFGGLETRLDTLERRVPQRRREITTTTRVRLADVTLALGGRCPCCGQIEVVDANGALTNGGEFDHFFSNQLPTEEHCWLICKICHDQLTTAKLTREDAVFHFKSFQLRRTRLVTTPTPLLSEAADADVTADPEALPGKAEE